MFSQERLENLGKELHTALSYPLHYQRRNKVQAIAGRYPKEFEWFASLALQLRASHNIPPLYNLNTTFDFSKDIGRVLYLYFNKDSIGLRKYVQSLPFNIQKLLSLALSGKFINNISDELIMSLITKYYTLAEIMLEVDLPDILDTDEVNIYALSRKKTPINTFPMLAISLPKGAASASKIGYLIKEGNKIVSNIISSKVREVVVNTFGLTSFGTIGFTIKAKGYKHRYSFVPVVFSEDTKAIKALYMGEGFSDSISPVILDAKQLKPELSSILKVVRLNNKEEFEKFVSEKKRDNVVYVTKEAIGFLKLREEITTERIVDWMLDDNYNPIGVYFLQNNEHIPLRFRVDRTDLSITGIKGRFVRVGRRYIGDTCVGIYYAGVEPVWHPKYNCCKMCGGVSAKHFKDGVCGSCVYKLRKVLEYNSEISLSIAGKFGDFTLYLDEYCVRGFPDRLEITLLPGFKKQLSLPFEEFKREL